MTSSHPDLGPDNTLQRRTNDANSDETILPFLRLSVRVYARWLIGLVVAFILGIGLGSQGH